MSASTVTVPMIAAMCVEARLANRPMISARRVNMTINGRIAAEETFPGPGLRTLSAAVPAGSEDLTVTLRVDKTFSTASDQRKLGAVIARLGF